MRANLKDDVPLWKQEEERYSSQFSTKRTWLNIRQEYPTCSWSRGIWFPHSTPKFSFLVWVAAKNRLQTCDRIKQWNKSIDDMCVLCQEAQETCQHLFFRCRYTEKIWRELVVGILREDYTTDWNEILGIISTPRRSPTETFLIRYTFQSLAHSIWKERNDRRHGEQPKDGKMVTKLVDKMIRLKLLLVKGHGKKYLEEGLCKWFETRT